MPKEKNLRTFMEQLEAAGLLARVKQEVDPRYELAGDVQIGPGQRPGSPFY